MTPKERREIEAFHDTLSAVRARTDTLDGLTREVLSVPPSADDDTLDGPLEPHPDEEPHESHSED